ncbi:MAG: hypothetical protein VX185_04570 [Pseudomonadota bacterium]|nr:hypothetical protein [Pseudomonadota bacterium]
MHISERFSSFKKTLSAKGLFNHRNQSSSQTAPQAVCGQAESMQQPSRHHFLRTIKMAESHSQFRIRERASGFMRLCTDRFTNKHAKKNPEKQSEASLNPQTSDAVTHDVVSPKTYAIANKFNVAFYNKDQAASLNGPSFDMFAEKGANFNAPESSLGRIRDAQYDDQDLVLGCLTKPQSLHVALLEQFNATTDDKIPMAPLSPSNKQRLNTWLQEQHLPISITDNLYQALDTIEDKERAFGESARIESVSLMGRSSIKSDQEFGILSSLVYDLKDYNELVKHTFGDYIPALREYRDPETQEQPFKDKTDVELVQSIFKFEKKNQPVLFEVNKNDKGTLDWSSFKPEPRFATDLSQFNAEKLGDPKKGVGFYEDKTTGKTYVDLVRCVPLMYHLCFLNPAVDNLRQSEDTGILTVGRGVRSNLSRAHQETYTPETQPPFMLVFNAGKQHYSNCNDLFKALAYAETKATVGKWQAKADKTPFDHTVLGLYQQKLENYKPVFDALKAALNQNQPIRVNGNGRSVEDFINRMAALEDFNGMNMAVVTRKGPSQALQNLVQKLSA